MACNDGPIDSIETGKGEDCSRTDEKDPDTYRFSYSRNLPLFYLKEQVDVLFPLYRTDHLEKTGTTRDFEMADIPTCRAGVLASSTGWIKWLQKLFKQAGLPVSDFLMFLRNQIEENHGFAWSR